MLRASCLKLQCHEAKIEESEKARSCWELNPGHFWLEAPVLCHWVTTARWPPRHQPSQSFIRMYCTGGTECRRLAPSIFLVICKDTFQFQELALNNILHSKYSQCSAKLCFHQTQHTHQTQGWQELENASNKTIINKPHHSLVVRLFRHLWVLKVCQMTVLFN